MAQELNVGDFVHYQGTKGYWEIVGRGEDAVGVYWKLRMIFTDDFKEPLKRVPCKLYNDDYATIISKAWIEEKMIDSTRNYMNLWAAIENAKRSQ